MNIADIAPIIEKMFGGLSIDLTGLGPPIGDGASPGAPVDSSTPTTPTGSLIAPIVVRIQSPSTAQLENDKKTCLGEVEMGLLPPERAEANYYGLKSVTKSLAQWYFSQWLLTDYEKYPLFNKRRERVEQEEQDGLTEICRFMTDYLLMACLGEARHSGTRHWNTEIRYYKDCADCLIVLGPNYEKDNRTAGATALWGRFTNRKDAFAFLLHVFCDHAWAATSLGGPRWGYVALITKRLNEAYYSNDRLGMLLALDEIVYLHHCSGKVWGSRFEWSRDFFDGDIKMILNKKSTGKACCWKRLRDWTLIKTKLYLGAEYCGCPNKEIEIEKNSQEKFVETYRTLLTCKKCDGNLKYHGACINACGYCKEGCFPKGTHFHACPGENCRRPIYAPFTLSEKCPGWCEECSACYQAANYTHAKCHFCKTEWNDWTKENHGFCSQCAKYGLCAKLRDVKGFDVCIHCLKNPLTLDLTTIKNSDEMRREKYLTLTESRPTKIKTCSEWADKGNGDEEPCSERSTAFRGSPSWRYFYCEKHAIAKMTGWRVSTYKRIKFTKKEIKEWDVLTSAKNALTTSSSV